MGGSQSFYSFQAINNLDPEGYPELSRIFLPTVLENFIEIRLRSRKTDKCGNIQVSCADSERSSYV